MRRWARILTAAGLLALGYWAFQTGSARLYQFRAAPRFAVPSTLETAPADRPAIPPKTPIAPPKAGSPIASLTIPRVALTALILEGAGERELRLGPGHILGTPLPGVGGNFAIAGHRDSFFRPLRLIRLNDTIVVRTHNREYRYSVVSTNIVRPGDVQVLSATRRETLTLVTCYPFLFIGAAPRRFVVRADCVNCGDSTVADSSK